jgi:hypothetical protein
MDETKIWQAIPSKTESGFEWLDSQPTFWLNAGGQACI